MLKLKLRIIQREDHQLVLIEYSIGSTKTTQSKRLRFFSMKRPQKIRKRPSFDGLEQILNMTTQRFQLSRPRKVGGVMEMIRACQPNNIDEWEKYYWETAHTSSKDPTKITRDTLDELGHALYDKIHHKVLPELLDASRRISRKDCIDYIHEITIHRTFDGYNREKDAVHKNLMKRFPDLIFKESPPELDQSGCVDYVAEVPGRGIAIGIQIKPITASYPFANYNIEERMGPQFQKFEEEFGGKVYIVYSEDGRITNPEVLDIISSEIA